MPSPSWYTIPQFGPSDLLTSDKIDQRRVKVESESTLEASIERGNGYALTIEIEIPNGSAKYFLLRNPTDKIVRVKSRSMNTGGGIRYNPLSGSTFVLGADVTANYVRNLNGNISNPPSFGFFEITSVSDEGTIIDVLRSPLTTNQSGNPVTYAAQGSERVVPLGSDILLKFDNIDNNDVWCVYSLVLTEEEL